MSTPLSRRLGLTGISQEWVIFAVAIVLLAVCGLFLSGFATTGNILALARNVSVLGILSLGMGIVVIGRGLDLSEIVAMCVGPAIALHLNSKGMALEWSLLVGMMSVVVLGLFNGFAIAFVGIPALFTTLASGFLVFGLARLFVLDGFISYLAPGHDTFMLLGQGAVLSVPMPIVVFILCALLVHVLLTYSSIGLFVYSHGDNEEAAAFTGIPTRALTILEYVLCAIISYLAGLVAVASTASVNTQVINSDLIFDVILVVVLGGISLAGGRGSVASVAVGTLLIGIIVNSMTILNLDGTIQKIIKGLVLLAAILMDNWLHPRDEETRRQGD